MRQASESWTKHHPRERIAQLLAAAFALLSSWLLGLWLGLSPKYASFNLDYLGVKAKVIFTDSSGDTDRHVQKWKVQLQEVKASKYTPSIIIFTQIKSTAGTQRTVIILCKGSTKSYFSVALTVIRIKS